MGGVKRKPLKRKNQEDEQPKKPVRTPSTSAESEVGVGGGGRGAEARERRGAEIIQRAWRGRVARCKVVRAKEVRVRNAAVCIQAFARGTREVSCC